MTKIVDRLRLVGWALRGRFLALLGRRKIDPSLFDFEAKVPIRSFYQHPLFDPVGIRIGRQPREGVPPYGLAPGVSDLRDRIRGGETLRFEAMAGHSFFGHTIKAVDAPGEKRPIEFLPAFGGSGEPILGGNLLAHHALRGTLVMEIGSPTEGFAPFTLRIEDRLEGGDGVLSGLEGYRLETGDNAIRNGPHVSDGRIELATGRLFDFHFSTRFEGSFFRTLEAINPGLGLPPSTFPGLPHFGHCLGRLLLVEDSGEDDPPASPASLELRIAAQMFVPLGEGTPQAPLSLPSATGPIPASNSSLHPFLTLRAREVDETPTASAVPIARNDLASALAAHEGRKLELLVDPTASHFGDLFHLQAPELEGDARGKSALFGRIGLQFGTATDGYMPFVLGYSMPSNAFASRFRVVLDLLPLGNREGLIGLRGELDHGEHDYAQKGLCLFSDALKPSIGIVELASGRIVAPFVVRNYLFLSMFERVVSAEPRTPNDAFAYSCEGFLDAVDGRIGLKLEGKTHIPYPEGYRFPLSGWRRATVGPGSYLEPFVHLRARQAEPPPADEPAPKDLEGIYRVTEVCRGEGHGAELVRFAADLSSRQATLTLRTGKIQLELTDARLIRHGEHRVWLLDARVLLGPAKKGETVLIATRGLGGDRHALVVASSHQDLDSHTYGER